MTRTGRARQPLWTGFVGLLVLVPDACGQGLVPSAGVDRTSIRLSESVRVTLAVEGPAPLRVELPADAEKLLTPASAAAWRIRPAGPPQTEPLPDNRERWARAYRLDPYTVGDVPVAFAAVPVAAGGSPTAQPVTFPATTVKVQTSITAPKAEAARPTTGIEELPPLPDDGPAAVGGWFVGGLAAVFGAVVVAVLVRRWRAGPPVLPPAEWAVRELDRPGVSAERVAAVLRGYVERRHGLPASKLTTAELATAGEGAGWPAEAVDGLRVLLERCDRAKFAGHEPAAAEVTELVTGARGWVTSSAGADP